MPAYQHPSFVEEICAEWLDLPSIYRLFTLCKTCMIIPGPLREQRLGILAKLLVSHPEICQKALADALGGRPKEARQRATDIDELTPERVWRLLADLVLYDQDSYERIAPLAILAEYKSAELFWRTLSMWADPDADIRLRLAAALTVAHRRPIYPDKARALQAQLAGDDNPLVIAYAMTEPARPIPTDLFTIVVNAPLRSSEERSEPDDFAWDDLIT